MEIKIVRATERDSFVEPGKIVTLVTIEYEADCGYTGKIVFEKPLPPKEEIIRRIAEEVKPIAELMGKAVKV
jgi:hypothetical protein